MVIRQFLILNFINLSIVKSICEILNELEVQAKQNQNKTKEKDEEIESLKAKIAELQKNKDIEVKALNLKITDIKRENDAEMQKQNQKIAELQRDKDRIVQEQNQKENKLKTEIQKLKEEIEKNNQRFYKIIDYNKDFDGIFNFLMKKTGGNIEYEVNITASHFRGSDVPKNVVLFDINNYFYSGNNVNEWICFEFKKYKVIPTNYSVKSYNGDGNAKPKTWVIEGLASNGEWKTIDNQIDCPYLKGDFAYHTFATQNDHIEEFTSIRMRLTGPTWRNDHVFLLHSFELYGIIVSKEII